MGFVLSILGIGKTVLSTIFQFIVKKPWIAATIVLACLTLWLANVNNNLSFDLNDANKTVATQKQYINDQTTVLDQYLTALVKEKKTLSDTIASNNKAVSDLKKAGDAALNNAKAEQTQAEKVIVRYKTLVDKYSIANSSNGTAEQRIAREQATTDQFFKDWNNIND